MSDEQPTTVTAPAPEEPGLATVDDETLRYEAAKAALAEVVGEPMVGDPRVAWERFLDVAAKAALPAADAAAPGKSSASPHARRLGAAMHAHRGIGGLAKWLELPEDERVQLLAALLLEGSDQVVSLPGGRAATTVVGGVLRPVPAAGGDLIPAEQLTGLVAHPGVPFGVAPVVGFERGEPLRVPAAAAPPGTVAEQARGLDVPEAALRTAVEGAARFDELAGTIWGTRLLAYAVAAMRDAAWLPLHEDTAGRGDYLGAEWTPIRLRSEVLALRAHRDELLGQVARLAQFIQEQLPHEVRGEDPTAVGIALRLLGGYVADPNGRLGPVVRETIAMLDDVLRRTPPLPDDVDDVLDQWRTKLAGALTAPPRPGGGTDRPVYESDDIIVVRYDRDRFREDYLNACRQIAEMYMAGTGRVGLGPVRGVVEDLADEHKRRLDAEQALTELRPAARVRSRLADALERQQERSLKDGESVRWVPEGDDYPRRVLFAVDVTGGPRPMPGPHRHVLELGGVSTQRAAQQLAEGMVATLQETVFAGYETVVHVGIIPADRSTVPFMAALPGVGQQAAAETSVEVEVPVEGDATVPVGQWDIVVRASKGGAQRVVRVRAVHPGRWVEAVTLPDGDLSVPVTVLMQCPAAGASSAKARVWPARAGEQVSVRVRVERPTLHVVAEPDKE